MANRNQGQNQGARNGTSNRGFASMDQAQQREIARMGGEAVSENRLHMAEIGRKGGEASAESRAQARAQARARGGDGEVLGTNPRPAGERVLRDGTAADLAADARQGDNGGNLGSMSSRGIGSEDDELLGGRARDDEAEELRGDRGRKH
jgi:hypothetical protein